MLTPKDVVIRNLGACRIDSPMKSHFPAAALNSLFVNENEGVLLHAVLGEDGIGPDHPECKVIFELAGPREKIYFDPSKTRCGIVTCGGLCPGLNEVIRSLVRQLWFVYGIHRIHGFKYGYQGFIAKYGHSVVDLTYEMVDGIQFSGGTMLGSSRGEQDPVEVVDCLERMGINVLFAIGGDGTLRGAQSIAAEIEKRGLKIALVGIPKTIDNDIMYVDESFGFQTAYSRAVETLISAHVESKGAPNGIGLVKLMGRHSGFIACHAALAMNDVNFLLIPEVPFNLEGENGLLNNLRKRLLRRNHAVIAVAEGAGQEHLKATGAKDASGNVILQDIGLFMKDQIASYFKQIKMDVNLKYLDPSYVIRSVPASPQDNIYCMRLAHNAVHAAMSGKTELVVGRWNGHFVHVPMALATSGCKKVNPVGDLWLSVLEATGQPMQFE